LALDNLELHALDFVVKEAVECHDKRDEKEMAARRARGGKIKV